MVSGCRCFFVSFFVSVFVSLFFLRQSFFLFLFCVSGGGGKHHMATMLKTLVFGMIFLWGEGLEGH